MQVLKNTQAVFISIVLGILLGSLLAILAGCTINTRRQRPGPPMTCYLVAMRCTVDTGAPPPPLTLPKEK